MLSRPMLIYVLCGGALLGCGSGPKKAVSSEGFSKAEGGARFYPVGPVSAQAEPEALPSRIPGSNIEPIGRLIDPAARLEALTSGGLAAKRAPEVATAALASELGQKLAAVLGPKLPASSQYETSLESGEFATVRVRLEPDLCYAIAAVTEGLEGLRIHLLAGAPWPPTVIAQSSLLLGAGSLVGLDGCLRSPDVRGLSVYVVLEGTGSSGRVRMGLFELRN